MLQLGKQLISNKIVNMQGAYKFGKMKFPEFSRPSKQLFPDTLFPVDRINTQIQK